MDVDGIGPASTVLSAEHPPAWEQIPLQLSERSSRTGEVTVTLECYIYLIFLYW
jgi:hypothetical protein